MTNNLVLMVVTLPDATPRRVSGHRPIDVVKPLLTRRSTPGRRAIWRLQLEEAAKQLDHSTSRATPATPVPFAPSEPVVVLESVHGPLDRPTRRNGLAAELLGACAWPAGNIAVDELARRQCSTMGVLLWLTAAQSTEYLDL
ncbi:hypothetical protein FALBO_5038 [Fusarium albosuccineum]|uniref:Uncharacterized protein n=1 Tax=Fusarium albosuccineum TaxID=1237068 RepID=A0A8H4LIH0_9HYPO|nr:hypothetical protein FALBO_5038 [Fusarium albosuccineum]KAF4996078.1 hypothetical protein FDECE_12589 [Fusarium decemcellulare]